MYRTSVFLLFNPSTETILSAFRLFLKYNILSVVLQTSNLDYVKLHLVVAYTLSGVTCIFGLGQVKVLGIETFAFIGLRGHLFFTDTLNGW